MPRVPSAARVHPRILCGLPQVPANEKENFGQINDSLQAKEGGGVSQRRQGASGVPQASDEGSKA